MTSRIHLSHRLLLALSLLIIWLGFAIRIHNLGGDSFWMDEIFTVRAVQGGSESILQQKDHPPLMYAMTAGAVRLFGESEFAARLPSMLAGTLALPLLVAAGKVLDLRHAALWAALWLALSPFHLKYSQEARHYALLLTFALTSTVTLMAMLKRGRWRYVLGYALATLLMLYTHYGAFLVLASQGLVVLVYAVRHWRTSIGRHVLRLGACGLLVLLLYLPQVAHLRLVIVNNISQNAGRGATDIAPITVWLREMIEAFASGPDASALVIAGLFVAGLASLAFRRRWLSLAVLLSGSLVPLLLIHGLQVARWAFPKYVIFIMPLYLLTAAVAVQHLLKFGQKRLPVSVRTPYALLALPVVLLSLLGAWPAVRSEYRYVERDWRGLAQQLNQSMEDGDIILALTMDLPDGFNQVAASLPYYLDQQIAGYTLLEGGSLHDVQRVEALAQTKGDVYAVLFNRLIPMHSSDARMERRDFEGSIYLVRQGEAGQSALHNVIRVYEQSIQFAVGPSPRCLLHGDLVALLAVAGRYAEAEEQLAQARSLCPERMQKAAQELEADIVRAQMEAAKTAGHALEARRHAAKLLKTNARDEEALDVLTAFNLMDAFERGEARVQRNGAPEPIGVAHFSMPQNGDSGNVLFTHPPASVSFHVTLPDEPVSFRSRVALSPETWGWAGDGATFILKLQTESGEWIELYRHHLANSPAEHGWHDINVSLAAFAGQTVNLTLTTEVGPGGDGTGDWAGWQTPRLMWELAGEA